MAVPEEKDLSAQDPEYHDVSEKDSEARRTPRDHTHPAGGITFQLERFISLKPLVAFGLTLQASWKAIALSFQASMLNGGPLSLVYGMLFVVLGSTCIAASLGEMASVDPVVGAQYRWAARYAPKGLRPIFWGLVQGTWVLAWIAACALTPFLLGTVVQALSAFNNPSYEPKQWHGTLLMWAFAILPVVWNLWARRLLVPLEVIGGICHFIFFLCTVMTLGVLAPRSTNSYVWTTLTTGFTGWENRGISFCLGLLSPAFAVSGFDGVVHMSDETKNAPRRAPHSMVLTVVINTTFAWCFIICLLYCLGSEEDVLASASMPIITVYYTATKSVAATNILMAFIIIVASIGNFNIFASVSRLTWAFARDRGLPFSEFFAYVHPTLKIPLNSLILVAACSCLLAIINIASTTAFFAVLSLATLSLYISYLPPIVFILVRKLTGEYVARGPWSLGRLGVPVNVLAIAYAVFMIIFLPFPTALPVDKDTMNYAAPVWGGCVLIALADYFIGGRKRFQLADEVGRSNVVERVALES